MSSDVGERVTDAQDGENAHVEDAHDVEDDVHDDVLPFHVPNNNK